MTEEGTGPVARSPTPAKKKRQWHRWAIGGGILVVLSAVALAVVPKYAARYVMQNELAKLGIRTTGVETVDVKLWTGEVYMGPVEFWTEGAQGDHGLIGRVGADLSLRSLFKQRALIETFFIEGVDLIVEKGETGVLLNGISLAEVATIDDAAAAEAEAEELAAEVEEGAAEEQGRSGWGAGIDRFDIRDSKLIVRNFVPDDDLEIEIDSMFVTLFHTWQPEKPGVISLRGSIQGAEVSADVAARPFGEDIQFRYEASIIDLPVATAFDYGRISLGMGGKQLFTDRTGTASQISTYAGVLYRDGWIEMNGRNVTSVKDFHIRTPAGDEIDIGEAEVNMLSTETYTQDGRIVLSGELKGIFRNVDVITADDIGMQLEAAESGSNEFFVSFDKDQSYDIYLPHKTEITDLRIQPHSDTEVTAGTLAVSLPGLEIAGSSSGDIELAGTINLDVKEVGARASADTTLTVDALGTTVTDLSLSQTEAAGLALTTAMRVTLENTDVRLSDDMGLGNGRTLADFADLSLTLDPEDRLQIKTKPTVDITDTEMTGATPFTVEQVEVALGSVLVELAGETISVNGSGSTTLSGASVSIPAADEQPGIQSEVGSLRLDLDGVNAKLVGDDVSVIGAVSTVVTTVSANVDQPDGVMAVAADEVRASLATLDAKVVAGTTSLNVVGEAGLAGVETSMPALEGLPQMSFALGDLGVSLEKMVASLTDAAPEWQIAAAVEAEEIGGDITTGDHANTFNVASLAVTGAEADGGMTIIVDEISIDGVSADVTDQLLTAFGGGESDEAAPQAETASAADMGSGEATVQLGRLAITGEGSAIRFTDTSTDPPVISSVALDDVEIKNVDTGEPATKTDLKVNVKINEFTDLDVTGWATPMKPTPDFDLAVDLKNLALPTYSPYISGAIGWHLDAGELDTDIKATATDNSLNGQLGVIVDNLFLNPVTAEDGEELEDQLGVPVQFAVGILKDGDGRIDLEIPLAGTVDQPEIDYSDVIRTALSGFLGSIFGSDSFQGAEGFDLTPIVFSPGSPEFGPAGKQAAEPYVTLLTEKSTLKLGVCGRATAADFDALFSAGAGANAAAQPEQGLQAGEAAALPGAQASQPNQRTTPATAPRPEPTRHLDTNRAKQLIELAQQRTNTVRQYLITDKGIPTERIVQCRVSFDLKDDQAPRVQFAM